jgi:hypothetical protein
MSIDNSLLVREREMAFLGVIGTIGFMLMGMVQFFAIWDGVAFALDIPSILAFILALFLAWMPLVGAVAGVYGAVNVWDWVWWQAGLLFFGVQLLALAAMGGAGGLSALRTRR